MKIKIKLVTVLLSFFFVIEANAFCIPKWVPFVGGYCSLEETEVVDSLWKGELIPAVANQIKIEGSCKRLDYNTDCDEGPCISPGKMACDGTCIGATVITPTSWSPDSSTVCSGTSFTQISDCGSTRSATGTKHCGPAVGSSCSFFSYGQYDKYTECSYTNSNYHCVYLGQSLIKGYCSAGYKYIQCDNKGTIDAQGNCVTNVLFESSPLYDGQIIFFPLGDGDPRNDICTATYQAKIDIEERNCPVKDSSWCVVGTQSYVDHYCSGGHLYITCQESGTIDSSGKCCGSLGYCDGEVY
jgi:hypothetical protein